MARLRHRIGVLAPALLAGAVLGACGSSGAVAEARQSCQSVHRSLGLERQSNQPGLSQVQRAQLRAQALSELLRATPAAAAATSIDGSWNPLMTTINEAERVPISELVPALTRLCQVADSSTPYL